MALATYKDLCIDAVDARRLGAFWAGALDLRMEAAGEGSRGDVVLRGPTPGHTIWVNQVPEPRAVKQRLHLDVNVHTVEELTALGATVLDADTFGWTVLADPEGGELCAFVREGVIDQRLYEIGVDCADSAPACHRAAAWWADLLGAVLVDDPSGYSWVQDIPGAPFTSLDFVPVAEPKTVKNRIHLDVTTPDLGAVLAHGARVLRARDDEVGWTVLADPDGRELCAFEVSG